ncbi:hypothetical protein BIV57_18785 [Mangrovactinospora gilvigrisea]|uniref:DUF317 domain-containing protein n=1 Tax=Mangrovactinospora gilvigrisea TaxID=1428644 RepID=A0A1J7BBA5_9ACTN|nr:DUF317 domain-containing protein [Mangrovactinospora gilvigrisea]OIV35967.1 hypothetical protein BIV57_18785 [Mangrovactinospora gilvigrisea]
MPDSGTPHEPDPKLLVSPRYLAGPTRAPDAALFPLLDAGWPFHTDHLDNLYFASPDERIRIAYLPQRTAWEAEALWYVTAWSNPFDRPQWTAQFTDHTPEEVVAGLTRALLEDYADGRDRHLHRAIRTRPAIEPLEAAGWHSDTQPGRYPRFRATSPDGHAVLEGDRSRAVRGVDLSRCEVWTLHVRPPHHSLDEPGQWSAHFTYGFPPLLLGAVTSAMTDPAPVRRRESQIPEIFRSTVRCAPAPGIGPASVAEAASSLAAAAIEVPAEPTAPAPPAQPPRHRRP